MQEYLLLVQAGLMWFLFRLSVPETQLCEQWSGEAWTQPPVAISVERRQPNKHRKAWCAQVTAQPAVKKHLTVEIVKAVTCHETEDLNYQSHTLGRHFLGRFHAGHWRKWLTHIFIQRQLFNAPFFVFLPLSRFSYDFCCMLSLLCLKCLRVELAVNL